jgi:limonene-1,2-epoxide hydrolase
VPVNGIFELRDGKIVRFSDYFNLADWEKQSGMPLG